MITCTLALLSALSLIGPTAECYSGTCLIYPDYHTVDDYERIMFGLKKEMESFLWERSLDKWEKLEIRYHAMTREKDKPLFRYEVLCALEHAVFHMRNEINRTLFRKRHSKNDDIQITSRSKSELKKLNLDATRIGDLEAYKSMRFQYEFIRDTKFVDISKPAFDGPDERTMLFTILDTWGCGNLRRNIKYLWVDQDAKK